MGFLAWLAVGIITGIVAALIKEFGLVDLDDPGDSVINGIVLVFTGLVGAFLGGIVGNAFTHTEKWYEFSHRGFLLSILGSFLMLWSVCRVMYPQKRFGDLSDVDL